MIFKIKQINDYKSKEHIRLFKYCDICIIKNNETPKLRNLPYHIIKVTMNED